MPGFQAQGNGADGAGVPGDVVPGGPVAAGGRLDELARFITQGDGDAVDLRVDDVFVRFAAQPSSHAVVELAQLLLVVGVVDREHGQGVLDLRELGQRGSPDALGRRIGRDQVRVLLLEFLEFGEELVIVAVGDDRLGEHVVGVIVAGDLFTQGFDSFAGVGCVHCE